MLSASEWMDSKTQSNQSRGLVSFYTALFHLSNAELVYFLKIFKQLFNIVSKNKRCKFEYTKHLYNI